MSDLVETPEDRFSHVAVLLKLVLGVSEELVNHSSLYIGRSYLPVPEIPGIFGKSRIMSLLYILG